jgi:hypothetical protein
VEWANVKYKKRLASFLLMWMLVATSMVVVFPLCTPEVRAEVDHLANTMNEDWTGPPAPPNIYDIDPTPMVVMWNPNDFHVINEDYTVMSGTTLIIPAMNYVNGMSGEYSINVTGLFNINVQAMGTLVTYNDNNPMTKTAFLPPAFGNWEGIYFQPLSYGNISDCWFRKAQNGIQFMPGSELLYPGITDSKFEDYGDYGLLMDGVKGYTNVHDLVDFMSDTGYGIDISNGQLNFSNSGTNSCKFWGHGPGQANLRITNATVSIDEDTYFYGRYVMQQPGNCIQIRDNPTPNSTVISESQFYEGTPGFYYIRCDGASPFIDSASFKLGGTALGALTLVANDNATGASSHAILRNPINSSDPASPFHESTCDATGESTVAIQWYLDVYVKDQDDNPIPNAPVWVNDSLGNPAEPPTMLTDGLGYAVGFVVTELIIYKDRVENFNIFYISAKNGSLIGYADLENSTITSSRMSIVIVPSPPPIPPAPPAPTGLQAKLVADGKDIMLFWNASVDDGGSENDVAGYTVYKSITDVNGKYEFAAWIKANGSSSYKWTDSGAGDGDWNDYFYIVRANDTLNKEEQNENKVGKFANYLVQHWNLISGPLIQTNTSLEYVLQTIEGNYTGIFAFHAGKSRPWLHWHRDRPNIFNDVIEINHQEGYYIDMTNPDYLVVAGKVPTNAEIQLNAGWNLVGYPCLINMTCDNALSSISGLYTKVEFYNTTLGKEQALGPDDLMCPGFGYWIHVTANCIWELPY